MFRQSVFPFPRRPVRIPTFSLDAALGCATGDDSSYSLFVPLHYERRYAYPLLVWLHGPGSDEGQLPEVMRQVSIQNYLGVAPRGNRLPAATEGDSCIYLAKKSKQSLSSSGFGWLQTDKAIQEAEQRVFGIIEMAAQRYHFSRQRIFLAGYESGGTMAMRLALRHPRFFAGVASFGGALPGGQAPFGNLANARKLNLLILCGRSSSVYTPELVCDNLRLLHAAGIPVSLRQYPGGQELSPAMLADLNRWIIEQITAPADSVQAAETEWSSKME
jgi:phospholipase/carboxylesterase